MSTSSAPQLSSLRQHPDPAGLRARNAVFVAFFGSGFGFASWASRIPQVRDILGVSPAELGIILLAIAIGSMIALPLAGLVVTRLGASRTVAVTAVTLGIGLAVVALGYSAGVLPIVVGLFLLGFANGTWDVAMNVQGAAVEKRLNVPLMPRFHAGFSVGTVAGALLGAGMVALDVSVRVHLLVVAVLVAVVVPVAVRNFLPAKVIDPPAVLDGAGAGTKRHPLAAWKEKRTLLIGLFVLCMAFTEGTGNDWLGVAVIDGYHASPAVGTLTFALFLTAMTLARWVGPSVLEKYGRVAVLRTSAVTAFVGLMLVVFGQGLAVAMIGSVFWGLGAALGFPVGMSAAADDEEHAAGRVSVVSSIGYTAFLAGPPLIGLLGDHIGVLKALTVAAGLLAIAILLAGACRPLGAPAVETTKEDAEGG